jgi:predicted nicotinamide N-methyase
MTSRVWGYIYKLGDALAVYYVEWTPGHETNANLDLILGTWGDDAQVSDRQAVALEYRVIETGPAFMVIDADRRNIASNSLVSKALTRAEVIGTPLSAEIFAICDLIYLEDERIATLRA